MQSITCLSRSQNRTVLSLSAIFCCRMLGLFIILPVFALYAQQLQYATPKLMGIALGIYGLTQALCQIPLAMLSDRIGRKSVIVAGLLIFIAGSIVAALSTSIYGVILGRALQGAGAVGSAIIALVADLTTVESRTKAMAVIGMSIGVSFGIAMVLGPFLNEWIGLSGLFWLTAALGMISILLLLIAVPRPPRLVFHRDTEAVPALLKTILVNAQLWRLNVGIAVLHAILTASFIAIPISLAQKVGLDEDHQWVLYLLVLGLAFVAVMPCIILAEKRRQMKTLFLMAILTLGLTQLLLWHLHSSLVAFAILLFVFFTSFTFLEAILPSLISKIAPAGSRGTAVGIYSSAQFLGIFLGGSLGGWIYSHFQIPGIFLFCAALSMIWLFISFGMRQPPYLSTLLLNVGKLSENAAQTLSRELKNIRGVIEAAVMIDDGIAYLKVDKKTLDQAALSKISRSVA